MVCHPGLGLSESVRVGEIAVYHVMQYMKQRKAYIYCKFIHHSCDQSELHDIHVMQYHVRCVINSCGGIGEGEDKEHDEIRYPLQTERILSKEHQDQNRDKKTERVITAPGLYKYQ